MHACTGLAGLLHFQMTRTVFFFLNFALRFMTHPSLPTNTDTVEPSVHGERGCGLMLWLAQ